MKMHNVAGVIITVAYDTEIIHDSTKYNRHNLLSNVNALEQSRKHSDADAVKTSAVLN